ncbi:hypothetical protein [Mesorhizobium sp.]|uniref:hypothetical protein n=1 Tax=Mesorhizobium sp. TaxID=1871066 RepID=UPI0025F8AEFB|nr:hypothetical protein [Mesorhizobium sp.]
MIEKMRQQRRFVAQSHKAQDLAFAHIDRPIVQPFEVFWRPMDEHPSVDPGYANAGAILVSRLSPRDNYQSVILLFARLSRPAAADDRGGLIEHWF